MRHRRVRRWAKSPIRDEQVLLHLSHGQTVPVVLMTYCLRAARFLSSSATRDSSNDAVADTHAHTHTHTTKQDSAPLHNSEFDRSRAGTSLTASAHRSIGRYRRSKDRKSMTSLRPVADTLLRQITRTPMLTLTVNRNPKPLTLQGTKVRRYNWHSAGSRSWPFPMLKY